MLDDSPVFIAAPSGNGQRDDENARCLFATASRLRPVIPVPRHCGALTHNFNLLLCDALNAREAEGIRWMAMIHADIQAAPFWLDTLIAEAEAHDADLMSAVVAIKDHRGLTTTAIGDPANPWTPFCRLTLTQILDDEFPETFDIDAARRALADLPGDLRMDVPANATLDVNVGCMVYRIDRPWATKIHFEVRNRIVEKDGQFEAEFQSDDWLFAKAVAAAGGRVFATRKVKTIHRGGGNYGNDTKWGYPVDKDCLRVRARSNGVPVRDPVLEAAFLT